MASIVTTGISCSNVRPAATATVRSRNLRRRIDPQAGRALEVLGHAIEYMTDELVQDASKFSSRDDRLEAIQILMAVNREVYFACPEALDLYDRCKSFLRARFI